MQQIEQRKNGSIHNFRISTRNLTDNLLAYLPTYLRRRPALRTHGFAPTNARRPGNHGNARTWLLPYRIRRIDINGGLHIILPYRRGRPMCLPAIRQIQFINYSLTIFRGQPGGEHMGSLLQTPGDPVTG